MNTHIEQSTEERKLAAIKAEIGRFAKEAKALAAWIGKQEEILKEKKDRHKLVTKWVKELIKEECHINRRERANMTFHPGKTAKMNSRIYGHAVEDASHRQFANNL